MIYVDHGMTGTNRERPGLREALAACRPATPWSCPSSTGSPVPCPTLGRSPTSSLPLRSARIWGMRVAQAKGHPLRGKQPELIGRQEAHLVSLVHTGDYGRRALRGRPGYRLPRHRAATQRGASRHRTGCEREAMNAHQGLSRRVHPCGTPSKPKLVRRGIRRKRFGLRGARRPVAPRRPRWRFRSAGDCHRGRQLRNYVPTASLRSR